MTALLHFLPIIAVALLWLERMREVATKRDTVSGQRRERLTLFLFVACGVIMFAGGIAEYLVRGPEPNWVRVAAGFAITVAAFAIRRRSIAALGKFWSLHVEMREGHEFVQSGPFRWMRHPVYFSMILELAGPAIILGAWRTLALVAVIFLPTLWWRLHLEEAALVQTFGPAYETYRRTTPMLIPYLRPRRP
ncbi:MAG: hypothetical protein QOE70_778 [Chthoniobacter sp.]|jgi:protein-S-isoprenylcysteine O-methyltransferase Ste14|nr:hypothetical protein [Chthoniobacter sp.]